MQKAEPKALLSTVERALSYYRNQEVWKKIQRNGMRQNLDWSKSAQAYMQMYQAILNK